MHIENVHIHFQAEYPAALKQSLDFMEQQQGTTHGGYFGHAGWAGATLRSLLSELQGNAITVPKIGEYWKGQGGVLVGIARGYDGKRDRHLILPTDQKFIGKKRALGTYGVDVQGASSDHDGMANTIALAKAGSELCQEILGMEVEGHKDLYLMSRQDARLCMANVPELFEKEWYLTSTQSSEDNAWFQDVGYGHQYPSSKKFEALFRPVRSLVL